MKTLMEALADHGRVGLVLSAGYFGYYGHAGMLLALEQAGIRPAALAGSSAGAVVSAFAAAGFGAQRIVEVLGRVRRQDFWDPVGISELLLRRDLPAVGLLRGERLRQLLQRELPVQDFAGCQRPLFIEAANLSTGESEVFDSGELAQAVRASCALPGLFMPTRVGQALYWDGGMLNKIPVAALLDHVDAVLIHWLQSAELARPLSLGLGLGKHLSTLVRGFAMARRENSRLQARLALERGLPVYVIRPTLPRMGPLRLHLGPQVAETARQYAMEVLAGAAEDAAVDPLARVLE